MSQARLVVDVQKRLSQAFQFHIRLEVGSEILVLFGPSGAGKTTTLNAIAGLVTPDEGEILLDGQAFFRRRRPGPAVNLPARKRKVGYVFQQYLLFPHLTALENVAYPLWGTRDGQQQATALLERMHLGHLAQRYPSQLSGGQQQRVAIARSLATHPQTLLLDEPFSALESGLRARLQQELRDLQRELGLVVIYVTHRLEDAFAIGDRLAVIRDGVVEQIGKTQEVVHNPVSHQVAEAIGIPNLFSARVIAVTPETLTLDWDGLPLEVGPQQAEVGSSVTAYIQPEEIRVLYPDRPVMSPVTHNQVIGRIVATQFNAGFRTLRVRLTNGHEVEAWFPASSYLALSLEPETEVYLSLRKEGLVVLDLPREAPVPTGTDQQ